MEFNVIRSGNPGVTSVITEMRNIGNEVYQRLENMNDRFINKLVNVGSDVIDKYRNSFNMLTNRTMVNNVLSNLSSIGGLLGDDRVNLVTPHNYMRAGTTMRRYIMANPVVYNMYRSNKVYGYGGEFIDNRPELDGYDRLDYKEVMDGVMDSNDDGMFYRTLSTNHKNPLCIDERIVIRNSWKTMVSMIANDEDITEVE